MTTSGGFSPDQYPAHVSGVGFRAAHSSVCRLRAPWADRPDNPLTWNINTRDRKPLEIDQLVGEESQTRVLVLCCDIFNLPSRRPHRWRAAISFFVLIVSWRRRLATKQTSRLGFYRRQALPLRSRIEGYQYFNLLSPTSTTYRHANPSTLHTSLVAVSVAVL